MPCNIEIKASIRNPATLRARVVALAQGEPEVLRQEDTFFHTSTGRLKLRVFGDGKAELIYYEREDDQGPTSSKYVRIAVDDPRELKDRLSATLGIRGVVRKDRECFLVENTRIHIDEVQDLGSFLELEVMLEPEQSAEAGRGRATELMQLLGVDADDLVSGAYIDLLDEARAG